MAYREKKNIDQTTSIPLSRLAKPSEISSYIKRLITASQYDFHELEAMEVKSVVLNGRPKNRGKISGTLLNSGETISDVKPIFPNLITVPVIGEHVVVAEYNGQNYYTAIINRKSSLNENSVPGISGTYTPNTKFGNTFERKKVKPIRLSEGSISFEGRFGQSMHFEGTHNKPTIKLSTHVDASDGVFRKENIDTDNSSIYITSDGLRGQMFNGQQVKNNSVLIRSDDILINSRKKLLLEGDEVIIHARKGQTIKMGDPRALFIPTIDAKVMAEFLKNLMSFINKTMAAIGKATNPATLVSAAKDIGQAVGEDLPSIVDTAVNEKYLNKQVMVADRNIPIPKLPKIPDPNKLKEKLESDIDDALSDIEGEVEQIYRSTGVRG